MDTITWIDFAIDLLSDESFHFALACFTGLWGFSLTLTTSSAYCWAWERLTRRNISTGVAYGILICCLLAGLSFALVSHWLLDYWSTLLTTPLGPPLQITPPAG